ncbi:hypothetical protein T03_6457 [Trichinella britovi]|uniref:Uncharacterized protein n=1 Tax=Trichinella britovi TaxID=45882 RepID=A0A0V1C6F8_TRIBR|nr:hypothetical protein T03_6457 [Trichinella britovi]
MFFLVTQVRNYEDESRILHDVHRNTIMSSKDSKNILELSRLKCQRRGKGKYEAYLYAEW